MRLARVRTTAVLAVLVAISFPTTAQASGPSPAPASDPSPPAEDADAPPPDDAPPEVRAEYWFGRGERLGESGDFVGAAKSFERSVEIMRTGAGLFNRAVAYEYASMFLEAYAAYEDYRDFVDPRSAEAEMAAEAMRKLRAKVGTIELGFARDHVPKKIFVDGDERGRDEFPLLVMPGEHEVVVVERNDERRTRSNRLEPGTVWTVDFAKPAEAIEKAGPGPVFQPPPAFDEIERERRRRIVRSLFYTSLGLTAASGVTLGVFGGLTLREARAFEAAQCGEKSECVDAGNPDYPADHERNFENYKLTTNVMVGVTAGLAATSVVLGIVGFAGSRGSADETDEPRVSFGPGAVRMRF
jgi:hypothetical protein